MNGEDVESPRRAAVAGLAARATFGRVLASSGFPQRASPFHSGGCNCLPVFAAGGRRNPGMTYNRHYQSARERRLANRRPGGLKGRAPLGLSPTTQAPQRSEERSESRTVERREGFRRLPFSGNCLSQHYGREPAQSTCLHLWNRHGYGAAPLAPGGPRRGRRGNRGRC
jgi:hypothetical protein